jgi:hypothetical protein
MTSSPQHIVYAQANPTKSAGFDYLSEYKPGQFSKSPKVCFPNLDFFGFLLLKTDSEAVEKRLKF